MPQDIMNFIKDVYLARYSVKVTDDEASSIFSWIVAIFPLGGLVGGFGAGWMANGLGRYYHLQTNPILHA